MADWIGDFHRDQLPSFPWESHNSLGASANFSSAGTLTVYRDGATGILSTGTQVGITDSRNTITGVHFCRISVASTTNFFQPGNDYAVVLSAATLDGQPVNAVVARFSIENRFRGQAYTYVAAGGGAQSITFPAGASSTSSAYDGWITRLSHGTGSFAEAQVTSYAGATKVASVDRAWFTAPASGTTFDAFPSTLAATTAEITTAVHTTAMTEAYATDGAAATPAQLLYQLWARTSEISIVGTSIICKKLDGSTTAFTITLDSASDPKNATRSA